MKFPLYAGGQISAGIDAAQRNSVGASAEEHSARSLLKLDVAEAYVGVVRARRALQAASASHHLQRLDIEHRLRQQLLELRVLGLELAELAHVRYLHPAVAAAPVVESRITESVLATQILHLHPGLGLLQDPDDLLLRKPRLLHVRFPFWL